MATRIYSAEADDLDGTTEQFSTTLENKGLNYTLLVSNRLDTSITLTTNLSHADDPNLIDSVPVSTMDLAADTSGYETLHDDPWELIGGELSFTANPSSGTIEVYLIQRDGK